MAPAPTPPTPGGAPSDFARATAATPIPGSPGRYSCHLDASWSALAGINGGILLAILARAIEAEAGPGRGLRTIQVQFMRPPKAAAAEVVVEVIRAGARATNLRIRLEQDGRTMLEGLATCFAGGLREIARWSPPMPEVPAPHEAMQEISDPRMPSIADQLSYRPRIGPVPLSGTALEPGQPARTGGWLELKGEQRIDVAVLAFFVDAWWPAALGPIDAMAFNPTIDLTFHLRTALPPEGLPPQPLLLDVTTIASLEGLCDEDTRLFTADGTLLAQSRQLAITLTPDDRAPVTKNSQDALK